MNPLLPLRPFSSRRRLRGRLGSGFIVILSVLLLAACYSPSRDGYLPPVDTKIHADKEPPPPRDETVPAPPQGPADYFAWDPGHWNWNGRDYDWMPGHYVERPYQGGVWVRGGWHNDGDRRWSWTPSHWADPAPAGG